jgi:hypothetical protein
MCDCIEYDYEELALGVEEKEPEKIAVQIPAPRVRKK